MPFGSLWLPVVVSAVAVWFVSAILHMVLKYHRADHKPLPNEDAVAGALRQQAPAPGVYFTPYCTDHSQLKDPAVQKRFAEGPIAIVTVMKNGVPNMGKSLFQWLLLCFLISLFAGTLARQVFRPGEDWHHIFHFIAPIALAGYGFGYIQDSIWKGIPWANSLRGILDAVVYAAVTGAVFCWLWPAA